MPPDDPVEGIAQAEGPLGQMDGRGVQRGEKRWENLPAAKGDAILVARRALAVAPAFEAR